MLRAKLGSEHFVDSPTQTSDPSFVQPIYRSVCVLTHAILDVVMCTLIEWRPIMRPIMLDQKYFILTKKVGSNVPRRSHGGKGNEVPLP